MICVVCGQRIEEGRRHGEPPREARYCLLCNRPHRRQHADFPIMPTALPERAAGRRSGGTESWHNQRLSRNASSWSSGRYRAGLTPSGSVRNSAFSFKRMSAWRYICVVSGDSCPSQSAITERSTPC